MNCLRCGKEIKENWTFCEGCWETVREPLRESPYLSAQVVLPTKRKPAAKPAVPAKNAKSREKAGEKEEPKKRSGALVAFLCVLCVLTIVFALVVSLFWLDLREEHADTVSRLSAAEKENREQSAILEDISQISVWVEPEKGGYYHTVDCTAADRESCRLIRITTAQALGYEPCPDCH